MSPSSNRSLDNHVFDCSLSITTKLITLIKSFNFQKLLSFIKYNFDVAVVVVLYERNKNYSTSKKTIVTENIT